MIKEIKETIERKIKLIGFNFDPSKVWEKEMISISFNEEESDYFPTWTAVYYSSSQREGKMRFCVRFSRDNTYLHYVDISSDIQILL